ncbi:hypothetical protein J3459_016365 [Metarhizium acridum]|nr:hypothetical protein J3459_016365 [Metarhizium acridum]
MACTCVSGDSPSEMLDVVVAEPPLSLNLSLPSPPPFSYCRATTARETGAGSSEASKYSMFNMMVLSLSSMFRRCSFRFGSPKMPKRSAELGDRWTSPRGHGKGSEVAYLDECCYGYQRQGQVDTAST